MPFRPTSTVTVSTATLAKDALGDQVETWTVSASGVAAHIHEHARRTLEPVSGQWTVTRYLRAFLDAGTAIARGDRLTDDRGNVFTVTHIYAVDESPVGVVPVRVELDRVEG